MKLRLLILTFILTLVSFPRRSGAQDDFRFQPPVAPPLDVDFGDDDDDEMGDFMRPPGAPPAGLTTPPGGGAAGGGGGGAPPPFNPGESAAFPGAGAGGGSANFGGTTTSAGKFRFKIVDGQFWQKGQKRQRGNETHVIGDEDSRSRGPQR